jgi:predicted nucleotide-binding protein
MDTPAVFIGSSTQGLDFARAARGLLAADAEITIWNEGFFEIGSTFIESLVNNVERFDFAILVMTPDDLRVKNGHEELQPRDNVIFELGLFMGRLGRARTFVLQQRHADLRLPSDLSGVTTALYDWPRDDKSHKSAVGPASDTIRDAMRQLGLSERKTQQQIREVAKEQKEQKSIIDEHQAFFDIVKYSISSFCYVALWHIENNLEYI